MNQRKDNFTSEANWNGDQCHPTLQVSRTKRSLQRTLVEVTSPLSLHARWLVFMLKSTQKKKSGKGKSN